MSATAKGHGPIRIGIVGAGSTTVEGHVPRFRAIDGVEIAGVVNRTRESSERVAEELKIPRVYEGWPELMADPAIDAVCIGTWPYMHRPLVLAALESGKHVLTEARMAMSGEDAREMLEASMREPELVAMVVPPNILDLDVMRKIIELIGDGSIGDVVSADFVFQVGFPDPDGPFTWRHDTDLSGFNVMMLGAWYEHLMRILGPATSVTSATTVAYSMRWEGAGLRSTPVPDHVEVLADMAGGALMHMRMSSVVGLVPAGELWVFGTLGTLRCILDPAIDPDKGKGAWLWLGNVGDEALKEIEVTYRGTANITEERDFIGAIRGEGPVTMTTFADGVRYMEFTEAVTRSAQERRAIALPL